MILSSSSVHVVERAPQNGCHECLSPRWAPVASFLSGRLSKISREVWPRLLSNHCFSPGTRSMLEFVCTLSEWSVYFPQPSGFPESNPHWPSNPNILRAHLPRAGSLGWGAWHGAHTPSSLGWTSAIVIILCNCNCLWTVHLGIWIDLYHNSIPPTHLIAVPSLYLLL